MGRGVQHSISGSIRLQISWCKHLKDEQSQQRSKDYVSVSKGTIAQNVLDVHIMNHSTVSLNHIF